MSHTPLQLANMLADLLEVQNSFYDFSGVEEPVIAEKELNFIFDLALGHLRDAELNVTHRQTDWLVDLHARAIVPLRTQRLAQHNQTVGRASPSGAGRLHAEPNGSAPVQDDGYDAWRAFGRLPLQERQGLWAKANCDLIETGTPPSQANVRDRVLELMRTRNPQSESV